MSYAQEKNDIEGLFMANWPDTPVVFENGPVPGNVDEWVRLSISNGDAFRASLGDNPAYRFIGVVFVQIFTRRNIGSGRAIELADKAYALFTERVLNNIRFAVTQIDKVPNDSEWYQINASTSFYRGQ